MVETHILQLGLDEDVFDIDAAQDSRLRQIGYADYIREKCGKNHLTNIVLTSRQDLSVEELPGITLLPVNKVRLRQLFSLMYQLWKVHRIKPVNVITTQDVHGPFWAAVLFSFVFRIPCIGQIHYDLASEYARNEWFVRPYGKYYEKLVLHLLHLFNGIRVVNTDTENYLHHNGYKGHICTCPVPVSKFPLATTDESCSWSKEGALRVIYVGRFVGFKNLDCWIETAKIALSVNRNIEFVLLGDGPDRHRIQSLCTQYGLSDNIRFMGATKPEKLAEWYSSADIILLTSIYEGFGRVIIEAMNYGVVPICTNVAGPNDIIQNGVTGILEEAVPTKLASHIVKLEKLRGSLEAMSEAAKYNVNEKFNSESLKRKWLDFVISFTPCKNS